MLGFIPAGAAAGRRSRLGFAQLQHLTERQPHHRRSAYPQRVAARHAQMPIAQIFAGLAGNAQHEQAPKGTGREMWSPGGSNGGLAEPSQYTEDERSMSII